MACNCTKIGIQGTLFCQECSPSEFEWLVPVETIPDPFKMDRNHAYITPDNKVYILDYEHKTVVEISGFDPTVLNNLVTQDQLDALQKYTAGEGVHISDTNVISIDPTTLSDKYVDTMNFVEDPNSSTTTLNYTYIDGTTKSTSFVNKEGNVYDDTEIKATLATQQTTLNTQAVQIAEQEFTPNVGLYFDKETIESDKTLNTFQNLNKLSSTFTVGNYNGLGATAWYTVGDFNNNVIFRSRDLSTLTFNYLFKDNDLNKTFTFSAMVKRAGGTQQTAKLFVTPVGVNPATVSVTSADTGILSGTDFTLESITFKVTKLGNVSLGVGGILPGNFLDVHSYKLEEGSKASPWMPSINDMYQYQPPKSEKFVSTNGFATITVSDNFYATQIEVQVTDLTKAPFVFPASTIFTSPVSIPETKLVMGSRGGLANVSVYIDPAGGEFLDIQYLGNLNLTTFPLVAPMTTFLEVKSVNLV